MATWPDLVRYVQSNYQVSDQRDNMIKMVVEVGDLRTQVLLLWHLTLDDGKEDWVQIESPIGDYGSVDVNRALQEVASMVCGGLGLYGNVVTFRHALPLLNVDINELERPMRLVTVTADRLERMLTGGADKY